MAAATGRSSILNFNPITHLDTFAVTAQLYKLKPAEWKQPHLLLRDGEPVRDTPHLEKWVSMKRVLQRARNAIMAQQNARQYFTGVMGRARVTRLDAGQAIDWHVDEGAYFDRVQQFQLALTTNPGRYIQVGIENMHLTVGALWWVAHTVKNSAVNFGDAMSLHLVFEMYRADIPDDEPLPEAR